MVYTVRFGFMKGLRRRGGTGFVSQVLPMSKEESFLSRLNLTGKTVYDIGGHVGLLTLFFAKSVGGGRVVTFEPNPENFERLCEHVKMNRITNVRTFMIGIGRERAIGRLCFIPAFPAQGSLRRSLQQVAMRDKTARSIEITVDSLDNQIALNNLPDPDFVKIDVEGLEVEVLQGMAGTIGRHRPNIYVELHGIGRSEKAANAREVVDILERHGYSLCHVESGRTISLSNAQVPTGGHLYGSPRGHEGQERDESRRQAQDGGGHLGRDAADES
jgi:FkbM family methyltransferase